MTNQLKFTIITVSYNSKLWIAETINSVASQTNSNIEHIIIDGASTDGTVEIIKSFGKKVSKFITEPDRGIYDALNKGIENASGNIIGLLHSDDELASHTVIDEVCKKFIQTSADIVYGDLEYVSNKNKDLIVRYWKSNPFNKSLFMKGWMPPHPSMFIRREVYKNNGSFDLQFKISSDYDYILRLMQNDDLRIEYLPRVITKMRMGGASNSSLKNIFLKSQEDYRIIKKNGLSNPREVLCRKNFRKANQFFIRK